MSKIKVQMENCYGIGKLQHEFEFTSDCPYSVVYAPNGTMKTSLTKTFQAYARGLAPGDLVYPDRESVAIFVKGMVRLLPLKAYMSLIQRILFLLRKVFPHSSPVKN